jgi:hypothetical protein
MIMLIIFILINFSKMIIRFIEIKLWKNKYIDPTNVDFKQRQLLKTIMNIVEVFIYLFLIFYSFSSSNNNKKFILTNFK